MIPLKLPPTIRTAMLEELPRRPELEEKLKLRERANIIEGYTLLPNTQNERPFKFFAEINIDNDRLWGLFQTLLMQMPSEILKTF